MELLLLFVAQHLGFLFEGGRYRFVDSRAETPTGDAMLVLESPELRIRLTRDRSQLLMWFQPVQSEHSQWFSPGLLRGLLTGERPKSEVLNESGARFLASALPVLEDRLNDPQLASETVRELQHQANLRAKELFG